MLGKSYSELEEIVLRTMPAGETKMAELKDIYAIISKNDLVNIVKRFANQGIISINRQSKSIIFSKNNLFSSFVKSYAVKISV